MNRSTVATRWNLELIEDNFQKWRDDPGSVDESWQFFFQGYDLGRTGEGRDPAFDRDWEEHVHRYYNATPYWGI